MVHKNPVISGESEKGKQYFGSERKEQYARERKHKKNIKEVTFSVLLLFCVTLPWLAHTLRRGRIVNIEYGLFANIYFVNKFWIGFAQMKCFEFH